MEAEGGAQQYCFGLSRVAQVGFTRFVAPNPTMLDRLQKYTAQTFFWRRQLR
jgi:hypothetical protein